MSTKHTPGPWVISSSLLVCNQEAKIVTNCTPMLDVPSISISIHEAIANARRIVACVNACEGISTETLETAAEVCASFFKAKGQQ